MKMKTMLIVLACVTVLLTQAGCNSDKETQTSSPVEHEMRRFVSVTATVEAIDLQKRQLTLRGVRGNVLTFDVDEKVERLNEIETGDKVTVGYYMSLATEIRQPTPEEIDSPMTVVVGQAKTPLGISPAAGGLQSIKAVVEVVEIDRVAETVTVKGPLGNYLTVRVFDPARLKEVKLGTTIVVTYTEAIAVSVTKIR